MVAMVAVSDTTENRDSTEGCCGRANESSEVCVCVCVCGGVEHNDGWTHDKTVQCSSNPKTKT